LRFLQQYFLCACSIHDILRRFQSNNKDWNLLPEKVALELNDTHPTISIAELMRILLDDVCLGWDYAWSLVQRTFGYTNHTLLPEALEKWPVAWFEDILPRHLEITYEINRRFLDQVRTQYPGDEPRVKRMSLIEEGTTKKVRMANLAIVGSHSTNGVAAIHTDLLKTHLVADFAQMFPERFNNKTNGVTQRRWLLVANPSLAQVVTQAIGESWIRDFSRIAGLKPLAEDPGFRDAVRYAKRQAKLRFIDWLRTTTGQTIDPECIFDSQIKRIHEYKRQLLNALHIIILYNRLRENPNLEMASRTFFFAGKAAPAYHLAKLIIKLINNLATTIDTDPMVRGRLKVIFLPDYSVSVAERLIPASDVSEQISTAGYESSGTSNMKFMMNGALTIGTRDGATVEMADSVGEENMFLFGLTASQVAETRGWYSPYWHYEHEPETRAAIDRIASGHFSPGEGNVFDPILDVLLTKGDSYLHLADLHSYSHAHSKLGQLYLNPEAWTRSVVLNIASSGPLSSDRTIAQYAREIWNVVPCPTMESARAAEAAN
jgi:starch phosphorylase